MQNSRGDERKSFPRRDSLMEGTGELKHGKRRLGEGGLEKPEIH